MIETKKLNRAGLLATQGIRGGANRKILERIKESGDIFWAQSDREWILDGATVHVSMIGFDNGKEDAHNLDGNSVSDINPDLTTSTNLTIAKPLLENQNMCFMGITPGGPFTVPDELANKWLSLSTNPNGKPNGNVLRRYFNGQDIVSSSRGVWIIDFGAKGSLEESAQYELPFEYVKKHIKPIRDNNKRAAYREKWWLHAESRPAMRQAINGLSRYIATPRVSKHRIFAWIPINAFVDSATFLFSRDDDYFFGILHSKIHELWARATGTQLREAESGFRYTPTSTFETFPFPWPPSKESKKDPRVQAISQAAKELVEQRDRWLNPENQVTVTLKVTVTSGDEKKKRTLTNLYNQRPTWLDLAHKKLDEAVFAAYGWKSDLSDEEILEKLLALNLERSKSK